MYPRPTSMRGGISGWRLAAACVAAATLGSLASTSVVSASANPGTASYEGQTISLSQGWQGATACVAFATGNTECFATRAGLQAAIALASSVGAIPATSCGAGFLYLFSSANYEGSELALAGPLAWSNLSNYGFSDEMSSWDNTTSCTAYVAKGTNGSGSQLTMPANDYSAYVGSSWDHLAQSVRIG